MRLPLTLTVVLFLAAGLTVAGVEPSPWQPEINQLRAQENSMLAHFGHLEWVLGFDPSPFQPVVNQLNTVARQLALRDAKIFSIVDPIVDPALQIPPDDLMPVLEDLDLLAGAIYQRTLEGFEIFDGFPEILAALATLEMNSSALQETIRGYLPELETDYLVRFYYDPAINIEEVVLDLFTWDGLCAAYEPGLTGDYESVLIPMDPETGTIPDYPFDVEEGVVITFGYATGFGTNANGDSWQFTSCGNTDAYGFVDIWFGPPSGQ